MTKIIVSVLLLLSLNLFAALIDNSSNSGAIEYKNGLMEHQKGNTSLASEHYAKACESGSMPGCTNLGVLYFTGDGVEENPKKAKKLLTKACKNRHAKACYHLGSIYKRGADGIDKNIRKSRMFYAMGCKIGYDKSCDQYNLIREKRETIGSGTDVKDLGYTYTTEIYGG